MGKLKILIVEDDPVTRSLLEKKLKKAAYEVATAKNGEEAVGLVSGSFFDVVLTDLMMPGDVDGVGVLEHVKERNVKTEVILITAYASIENAVEAMKKGASDYLTKPINFDELMLRLDRINTMKSLAKESLDLREAMDVTEKNAGQTIQDLEMVIHRLQHGLSDIKRVLNEGSIETHERIERALGILDRLII
ncbi:MAG: response regulator [Deltaproteobacteria bacterium]|nr:response regulator [Deltaproteobacteria bacterium]